MRLQKLRVAVTAASLALLAVAPVLAQSDLDQGQGKAVVTVLSPSGLAPANLSVNQLALKIDGKPTPIAGFTPLSNDNAPIQMVVLLDDGARESLGLQLKEISHFVATLPVNAQVAVAYMQNGRAALGGPLTTDHAAAVKDLRLPLSGAPGISGSPYFCLSDLAKHWPSQDRAVRRVVVMVTDGVDYYEPHYNPDDPYLDAAIHDAVRSRLIVYTIYWRNQGFFDRTGYAAMDGQNLMAELTQATGGNSYWIGYGDPVSFDPYFKNINRRLGNQYEIGFVAPLERRPGVESLKLKATGARLEAPQQVYVGHPASDAE
ncbi:MAG TPA: hypothetical protein VMA34_03410 [Terracidiphilus sp.]|nr:hypothetical protein [Terracidiphilus sp.]